MASIDRKADEPGLLTIAEELALPFKTYSPTRLREVEDLLTEKSDIVFKAVGCFGVAEAAALVSASEITGHKSELLLPKQKTTRATLAIHRTQLLASNIGGPNIIIFPLNLRITRPNRPGIRMSISTFRGHGD